MNKAIEFCGHCGSKLDEGTAFCGECGQPVDNEAGLVSQPPPQRDEKPQSSSGESQSAPLLAAAGKIKNSSPWIFVGVGAVLLCIVGCISLVTVTLLIEPQPEQPVSDPRPPASGESSNALVSVVNQTSLTICGVYISPSNQEDWGPNRLEVGQKLLSGNSAEFSVPVEIEYDFMVSDCNDLEIDESKQVYLTSDGYMWLLSQP
jgi:hypothetical protein